jgi:hypothetical protein
MKVGSDLDVLLQLRNNDTIGAFERSSRVNQCSVIRSHNTIATSKLGIERLLHEAASLLQKVDEV